MYQRSWSTVKREYIDHFYCFGSPLSLKQELFFSKFTLICQSSVLNKSLWSNGDEDIPICRARLTCLVWLSPGFTPDTCHLHWAVPRLFLSTMSDGNAAVAGAPAVSSQWGCFELFYPDVLAIKEWFHDMAVVVHIVIGLFLQPEFLFQWWVFVPVCFICGSLLCYSCQPWFPSKTTPHCGK